MASPDKLYVTFVDVDRDLLKIWGQKSRIVATYIERQLLQLIPEFNRSEGPSPSLIRKGMFCFAKYSDDNYYRARVISNVQNDSVGVLFVDYGNKNFIPISNIRIQNGTQGDMLAKMAEQVEDFYLSGVKAPNGGWTNEIINEVRHDICYDEFACKTVAQVADQKILEIQFHDDTFSNHLLKKQIVNSVSLQTQTQMILSYCSLVSNDPGQIETSNDKQRDNYFVPPSPTGGNQGLQGNNTPSSRLAYFGNEPRFNYEKPKIPVNFSRPPPSHFYPSKHVNLVSNVDKNNQPSSYYPQNHPVNHPKLNKTQPHSVNPVFNPMLQNQYNPMYQAKENASLPLLNSFNNVMIEALAKQIKQYIAEDGIKLDEEKIPQHYVSSILNVDGTYSVFVSCIDDGPWSFSIRLLSSESELEKLVKELGSCELTHIKPPIIVGQSCIALSQCGNYCRGVIVSVSHTAVKVYFVDFGNTEDLPVSSIYEFPPRFFKYRVLSQKFSLNGLQKVAYCEDIKRFFSEVVQDKLLLLRVISLEDDNLPTCELYLKDQNIKRILNEKIRHLKTSAEDEPPKENETENVVVTWVISPQKFFVQLRKRDSALNTLKKELAEVETKGQPISFQQLNVGFKCVCRYDNDGNWYRAVITALDSEDSISVFYIDYGNSENVNISLLRKYDSSVIISQMSPQAIQCSLKGFENEAFDQDIADKLESMILEKDLKMTVVSSDKNQICVQLLDNGQDVAQLLSAASQPKVNVSSPPNSENDWKSSTETEPNDTQPPNKFEKRNKFSENTEFYDKKDKNIFRGDRNKEKRNFNQQFSDLKCDKPQPKSTNQIFKKRSEDSGNWREFTRQSDDTNFYTKEKFPGIRGFNNKENNWNDRKPIDSYKFLGSREPRVDDWNFGRKFESSKGGIGKKFQDGAIKEKFEAYKGYSYNCSVAIGGRRFERRFDNDFDPKKKFQGMKPERPLFGVNKGLDETKPRKPIRKENVAPPGSKFEEIPIEIGQCKKGIVTYYFSPDEFYIQLLTEEDEFKTMMSDIQQYYSDKYSLRDPVQAGDIVIAQFSLDKVLYRAEVVKPSPVTVRYVDYGNQEPVGAKCTWLVDQKFLKLPAQVVRCRLSGIRPIGSDWPPPSSEIDKFFDSEEYNCTFLKYEDGVYEITMTSVQSGKDVASEIISAKLGKPSDSDFDVPDIDFSLLPKQILQLPVSKIESSNKFYIILNPKSVDLINGEIKKFTENKENLIQLKEASTQLETLCLSTDDDTVWHRGIITEKSDDKIKVWFMDRGDTIEILPEKIMTLPENLKIYQPQAVECYLHDPVSSFDETEFKSFVEKDQQLILIANVYERRLSVVLYDQSGQISVFQKAEDFPQTVEPIADWPLISRKTPVLISHFESPQEIYLQRPSDKDAIKELSEQLSTFYSERKDFQIEEGDKFVAANSIAHNSWRRGRIVSSTEDALEVFYVDFGNKESLPREKVRKLDRCFYKLSGFAKKLRSDVLNDEEVTKEMGDKILRFTRNKELLGYFKNYAGELLADLVLDGENISMLLKRLSLPADVNICTTENSETSYVVDEGVPNNENEENHLENDLSVVYMTHFNSPNDFFIQRETCTDLLNDLAQRLMEADSFEAVTSVQENEIIAAKFIEDGAWYRAKVTKKSSDEIEVLFIDYGNTSIVNEIKCLPSDLVSIPYLAENCCLIYGNNCDSWSEAACEKFSEYADGRPLKMKVVFNRSVKPIVRLFDQDNDISGELETLCEPDGRSEVYISQAFSPINFYMQFVNDDDYKLILEKLENGDEYENLEDKTPGTICQARFIDDGLWYRAKILQNLEEGCEVFFIDFGNISTSTEIKKLPPEIENIPPRALKCKLDLKQKNIPESVKEEFINLTMNNESVFRGRIITPGEVNVISLKVDGRILEETIILDGDSDDSLKFSSTLPGGDLSNSLDDETDDDKNSKITVTTESYLNSNLEDDARAGSSVCNETDEEKRVKIANSEGFKSDDEKGISVPSGIVNVTDNELIEEFQDANEEQVEQTTETTEEFEEVPEQDSTEAGQGEHTDSTFNSPPPDQKDETKSSNVNINDSPDNSSKNSQIESNDEKTVPGSISRGESEKDLSENVTTFSRKLTHSEKLVPGSISRGVSLEFMSNGEESLSRVCEKQVSQSAPNTPKFVRRTTDSNAYLKEEQKDRVVPGRGSGTIPISCNTEAERVSCPDKIISGSVNGSVTDN